MFKPAVTSLTVPGEVPLPQVLLISMLHPPWKQCIPFGTELQYYLKLRETIGNPLPILQEIIWRGFFFGPDQIPNKWSSLPLDLIRKGALIFCAWREPSERIPPPPHMKKCDLGHKRQSATGEGAEVLKWKVWRQLNHGAFNLETSQWAEWPSPM